MVRFLQRLKSRKGFTIIELIVVIVIIAVLAAVVLPFLNNERSRIQEARSTAKDFYAAVQTVMSKYSLYDGALSAAYSKNQDLGLMRHYAVMGGNYPYDNGAGITDHQYPAATSMYIMVYAKNSQINTVGVVTLAHSRNSVDSGLYKLLKRASADRNTEFGRLFTGEIEKKISFRDGYYYARVDFVPPADKKEINSETIKVVYTAYLRKELPVPSGSESDFKASFTTNNLYFGKDYKLTCDEICGTCAPYEGGQCIGFSGTKLS